MTATPINVIVLLFLLSLVPIIVILTTSFIKISVVLLFARDSLGVQNIPPNMVLYALALILSGYIMAPVYNNSYLALKQQLVAQTAPSATEMINTISTTSAPIKDFLVKHSEYDERMFFYQSLKKYWSKDMLANVKQDDFMIIVPAFVVGQLTQAFKIGFLVYLPAIIIDIIVSNVLMAMGMMMMSPVTISLPIKLLLFVAVDGWSRLSHMLLISY